MEATYVAHVAAGGLGLATGFVALYSAKGAPLHRRSGMAFVCAMLVMCTFGTLIAITRGVAPDINVPAGVLTAYLVITALITVRPVANARWLNVILMLVAFTVGAFNLTFAYQAITSPTGTRNGMPPFPFLMFGTVGILASVLDLRMIRAGGLQGARRLARHLWRMSFALFIAALSFFLGQAKVIPEPIRIPALLALPVVAVLVTMFYWLWRVRVKQSLRGIVGVGARRSA